MEWQRRRLRFNFVVYCLINVMMVVIKGMAKTSMVVYPWHTATTGRVSSARMILCGGVCPWGTHSTNALGHCLHWHATSSSSGQMVYTPQTCSLSAVFGASSMASGLRRAYVGDSKKKTFLLFMYLFLLELNAVHLRWKSYVRDAK